MGLCIISSCVRVQPFGLAHAIDLKDDDAVGPTTMQIDLEGRNLILEIPLLEHVESGKD